MAANVMSLNYVRPGFAVLTPMPTQTVETAKPVEVKAKAKTAPKSVRNWLAEAENAISHAIDLSKDQRFNADLTAAWGAVLKAQNTILRAENGTLPLVKSTDVICEFCHKALTAAEIQAQTEAGGEIEAMCDACAEGK